MREEFQTLIGFNGSVIDLSNELQSMDCEDICYFGNMEEILESGDMVVATDEYGDENIQIFFDVTAKNREDEVSEATIVHITNIEEYL